VVISGPSAGPSPASPGRVWDFVPFGVRHLAITAAAEADIAVPFEQLGWNPLPRLDVGGVLAAGAPYPGLVGGTASGSPGGSLPRGEAVVDPFAAALAGGTGVVEGVCLLGCERGVDAEQLVGVCFAEARIAPADGGVEAGVFELGGGVQVEAGLQPGLQLIEVPVDVAVGSVRRVAGQPALTPGTDERDGVVVDFGVQ